jgi:hypothetical protein
VQPAGTARQQPLELEHPAAVAVQEAILVALQAKVAQGQVVVRLV